MFAIVHSSLRRAHQETESAQLPPTPSFRKWVWLHLSEPNIVIWNQTISRLCKEVIVAYLKQQTFYHPK